MLEYPAWLRGEVAIPSGGTKREHELKDEPETLEQIKAILDLRPKFASYPTSVVSYMRSLEKQGFTRKQISSTLNIHLATVGKYLGKKRKNYRPPQWRPNEKWMRIMADIITYSGMSRREIARVLGLTVACKCHHAVVDRWCQGATPSEKYEVAILQLHDAVMAKAK